MEFGHVIIFWKSATASKWGRFSVSLAFRAAKHGLKTKLRALTVAIHGLCRVGFWGPGGTQGAKFLLMGLGYVMWRCPEPKFRNWRLLKKKLFQSSQFGDFNQSHTKKNFFFSKSLVKPLNTNHKVLNMSNLGTRVASGTHGHVR